MTRSQRLRRVALLCVHFTRNLAYYRAGWKDENLRKSTEFWKTVNGNFYDICILEWCKLFADKKDHHCWKRIVEDTDEFSAGLLELLNLPEQEWEEYVSSMRKYRDKFVAHLDSEHTADLPHLSDAQAAVYFYYDHLRVLDESSPFLENLPKDIRGYYVQCASGGAEVYA